MNKHQYRYKNKEHKFCVKCGIPKIFGNKFPYMKNGCIVGKTRKESGIKHNLVRTTQLTICRYCGCFSQLYTCSKCKLEFYPCSCRDNQCKVIINNSNNLPIGIYNNYVDTSIYQAMENFEIFCPYSDEDYSIKPIIE